MQVDPLLILFICFVGLGAIAYFAITTKLRGVFAESPNLSRLLSGVIILGTAIGALTLELGNLSEYCKNGIAKEPDSDGITHMQFYSLCAASLCSVTVAVCSLVHLNTDLHEKREFALLQGENAELKERLADAELALGDSEEQLALIQEVNRYFDRCIRKSAQSRSVSGQRTVRFDEGHGEVPEMHLPLTRLEEVVQWVHDYLVEGFSLGMFDVPIRTVLFAREKGTPNQFRIRCQFVSPGAERATSPDGRARESFHLNCSRHKQSAVVRVAKSADVCVAADTCVANSDGSQAFRFLYDEQKDRIACFAAIAIGLGESGQPCEYVLCVDSNKPLFTVKTFMLFRLIHGVLRTRFYPTAVSSFGAGI